MHLHASIVHNTQGMKTIKYFPVLVKINIIFFMYVIKYGIDTHWRTIQPCYNMDTSVIKYHM